MLIIWGSLFGYLVVYGEAVTKDPCSSCAKRMGSKVTCFVDNNVLSSGTFYVNGTIKTNYPDNFRSLNLSNLEVVT